MDEERVSLEEWRALSAADQFQYAQTLESLLIDANRVLAEIPPCPDHGYCTPYFRNWVRKQRGLPVEPDGEMLAFDRTVRVSLT